ncbi:DUF3445 domain-containing protein [Pseudooceanicola sp. 216_PA32_1]|uniref:DUF3445 domain-containing protein n=1 Tax=Pseudooceanicola pacificus TaxID=2676438 RepID=A0A844W579_9RHOB|nr:DUF3445 domain-containing protein [Pseudooceanicola pacificus]MWB77874.1 DUF3445 domain-containing protein [Pseudooceanicola pacificus]
MTEILQNAIPYAAHDHRRLPGIQPLDPAEWLLVDEAYAIQMAERARLLAERRDAVLRLAPEAMPAARELLAAVLDFLRGASGFAVGAGQVTRPDGRTVAVDPEDPLGTLALLVQEDFCLLQKRGAEHVLTGAVLCFPSAWTLEQKFMMPLIRIHRPVAVYDADVAKRVQRLFDGIRAGKPLWRYNYLPYANPALFQPRREEDPRDPARAGREKMKFLRSERQTLWRLPETDAVVFGIHTFVTRAPEESTGE